MCTGEDGGTPLGKSHHLTSLQVFLVPTHSGHDGGGHSSSNVSSPPAGHGIPWPLLRSPLPNPHIHDRICAIADRPFHALSI